MRGDLVSGAVLGLRTSDNEFDQAELGDLVQTLLSRLVMLPYHILSTLKKGLPTLRIVVYCDTRLDEVEGLPMGSPRSTETPC